MEIKIDLTIDQLKTVDGSLFQKFEKNRYYFNGLKKLAGLEIGYYKTGNVSSAKLFGEEISNRKAREFLSHLAFSKCFYDFDKKSIFINCENDVLEKNIAEKLLSIFNQ